MEIISTWLPEKNLSVLCSENTSPENSSVKTTQTSLSLSSHFLRLVSSDQYLSVLYYFRVVDGFSNVQSIMAVILG